jgi:hypothetical protein
MKQIEVEFKSNANQVGLNLFKRIKEGKSPDGKNVYIYHRTYIGAYDNRTFGYEVFIASVKKAGTYALPGGKEMTYDDDFEEYAGASKFGRTAFFHSKLNKAEEEFNRMTSVKDVQSQHELKFPDGEFSVTVLSEFNKMSYSNTSSALKKKIDDGEVEFVRSATLDGRKGKPTKFYKTT